MPKIPATIDNVLLACIEDLTAKGDHFFAQLVKLGLENYQYIQRPTCYQYKRMAQPGPETLANVLACTMSCSLFKIGGYVASYDVRVRRPKPGHEPAIYVPMVYIYNSYGIVYTWEGQQHRSEFSFIRKESELISENHPAFQKVEQYFYRTNLPIRALLEYYKFMPTGWNTGDKLLSYEDSYICVFDGNGTTGCRNV